MGDTHTTGRHIGGGTHITSDMCAGIHISRGYTYHCDTGTDSGSVDFISGSRIFLLLRDFSREKIQKMAALFLTWDDTVDSSQVFTTMNFWRRLGLACVASRRVFRELRSGY